MSKARPKVVLFDIGSTLWSSPAEDPAGLQRVYGRGRDILRLHMPNPPAIDELIHAVEGYLGEWEEIWRTEAHRVEQPPTPVFVADALKRIGVDGLPDEVLVPFTNAVMEASVETAKTLSPEQGMPEALAELTKLGVRLACVSNAFMGADVLNRIMEERGYGRHLDLTISSAETGIRKPDARIYEAAVEAMHTTPAETVFVGDRIDADVEGPQKLGMWTVLTHQYRAEDHAISPVKPDAVITHLSELPGVVEAMIKQSQA